MRIFILLIALGGSLFLQACNSCGPTPTTPKLAWGVLDKTVNVTTQHADGDTVNVNPGDQYLATLQVQEPEGIKQMNLSGAGNVTCATNPDSNGQFFTAPNPLPVSIPTQTTNIPNQGSTTGFVMSQPFVFFQLDCGQHQYGNMPHAEEFFATNGTLKITGTDITWKGTTRTATLSMTR
jgi:hypothetical protein